MLTSGPEVSASAREGNGSGREQCCCWDVLLGRPNGEERVMVRALGWAGDSSLRKEERAAARAREGRGEN